MKMLPAELKKPTLKTVVSLMMTFHEELKGVKSELSDVRETVEFLKDEAATKSDLAEFKSEVIGHIDHFVQLHKKQDLEIVALSHRVTRHEETFHKKK